jgi:hypothetical protein
MILDQGSRIVSVFRDSSSKSVNLDTDKDAHRLSVILDGFCKTSPSAHRDDAVLGIVPGVPGHHGSYISLKLVPDLLPGCFVCVPCSALTLRDKERRPHPPSCIQPNYPLVAVDVDKVLYAFVLCPVDKTWFG